MVYKVLPKMFVEINWHAEIAKKIFQNIRLLLCDRIFRLDYPSEKKSGKQML